MGEAVEVLMSLRSCLLKGVPLEMFTKQVEPGLWSQEGGCRRTHMWAGLLPSMMSRSRSGLSTGAGEHTSWDGNRMGRARGESAVFWKQGLMGVEGTAILVTLRKTAWSPPRRQK